MECANSTGAVAPAQPEGVKNASSIRPHVLRDSAGRLRRAVLRQPPHYRTGLAAAPAVDRAALDAVRAITASGIERTAYYRSNGVRAITT